MTAQDDGTFDEIGAAFQVKGDLKNAWSSAFRLRDSQFKVLEIATRLTTSKKRSAQRPFEFVFVLSDCSLLQAIKTKKPKRVSCDADEIVVYRKNEESLLLSLSCQFLATDSLCVFASQDTEWVEEEPDAEIKSGASKPRSRCEKQNCLGHTSSLFFACLFLFRTDCYGFTLPSACFSQQRCVLRSVAEVKPT